jgi:hypothetical protein
MKVYDHESPVVVFEPAYMDGWPQEVAGRARAISS